MEAVRETQKKFGSRAMITALVLGFALILMGFKPVGKGLVLGTCFSILNFVLIGELLPWRLGRSKRQAFLASLSSIGLRYAIMAIPLIMTFYFEQFHLVGVVAGLFMIQLVIMTDTLLNQAALHSGRGL